MSQTNATQYTQAVLSTYDGATAYTFLIQPEIIRYGPQSVFSSLPVLGTAQPLVKYKHSMNTVTIPQAKLWTQTGLVSIKSQLDQLVAWTMPDPSQGVPKLLKFRWGPEVIPRCYLVGFPHQITARMVNTEPTAAVGDIELLLAPEPPTPTVETGRKLTDREIEINQQKVDSLLQNTPGLRQELGLRSGEQPTVTADGRVVVIRDGQEIALGTLEAVLGDEVSATLRDI